MENVIIEKLDETIKYYNNKKSILENKIKQTSDSKYAEALQTVENAITKLLSAKEKVASSMQSNKESNGAQPVY